MGKLFLFQYIFMKDIPPGRLWKKNSAKTKYPQNPTAVLKKNEICARKIIIDETKHEKD